MKKINFIPVSEDISLLYEGPKRSSIFIPNWYKNAKNFFEGKVPSISKNNRYATNSTIKRCTPFLDGMTIGYMWYSPADIEIYKVKHGEYEEVKVSWMTDTILVTEHSEQQFQDIEVNETLNTFVLKWQFDYIIQTPEGYSTFFTHPINRHDLPFRTFSGVVDTDKYTGAVQFPFQLNKFEGEQMIIKKGTPLCQFFPFKRDEWDSKILKPDEKMAKKSLFDLKSIIDRSYKKQYWSKKIFN